MWQLQRLCAKRILSRGIPASACREYLYGPNTNILSRKFTISPRRYSTVSDGSQQWPVDFVPTRLELKSHPLGWEVLQKRVEPYFSQNWKFTSEREKEGFFALGFSRALNEWFPLMLDDRAELTGKMHYLGLLVDDQLDKMEMSDLLQYRERVMAIARGELSPNRDSCLEWMLHDTLTSMRSIDEVLANDVIEGFCALLQGQTTENRLTVKHLGPYLEYREVDVGRPFSANLHLTSAEIEQASALESSAFRFIGVFNDVYSWEKEWKTYQENKTDGAHPFSAIFILAKETGLSYSACKRMMLVYCRELELAFKRFEEEIRQSSPHLRPEMIKYIRGLEYLMSGVESWTKWTPRYQT
ncbi:hypothetical protein N7481_007955 [Penicillium waksmanii]|uniref:uncharacterized protein n=1 Tax=Penicillium waksmanii TaxID=69791 RepID=UPI002547616A|nr:uncharacterized protein N7481_007955 [Penicillium waksmanii]KAJ5980657.1 hypothetical protein N7481_007955 [Penicillium waksmanii]